MPKCGQSLNMDLFYEDGIHHIKEGNELLAKEIKAFCKKLSSTVYNTLHISYKKYNSHSNGASRQLTSV